MRLLAIALLLALPFLEIAVFTAVAGIAGFWPALSCLLATTFSGIILLRWQGPKTLKRLNLALQQGTEAGIALIDALGLVVAAILLLAPGFVTDLMALPLALPALRRFIGGFILGGLRGKTAFHVFVAGAYSDTPQTGDPRAEPSPSSASGTPVIEGEFRDVTPAPPPPSLQAQSLPPKPDPVDPSTNSDPSRKS
jgi:UPF0716 family protein affecting phage T7 exclusion